MTQEQFKTEALRLRPRLLTTARRYLGDDDAEDTVQDTLLRLWQMRAELHAPLDALALVLVRNLAVSTLRRRHLAPSATVSTDSVAEVTADAQAAERDERIARVMGIIEAMPPLQQTILRLRHIEGMEMADMAALIGSTEVALRKALSRARQAVRQQYLKRYEQ